jgi:hypothetical protein
VRCCRGWCWNCRTSGLANLPPWDCAGTFSLSNPTRPDLAPLGVSALVNSGGLDVHSLHRSDLAAGWGRLLMPYALARKDPNASREWAW